MISLGRTADVVKLGLSSLTAHKVRSVLTALGILFAVWAVIAMLAINQGFARKSEQELGRLGTDNLIIESIKPPSDSTSTSGGTGGHAAVYGLTNADIDRMMHNVPGVRQVTVVHKATMNVIVPAKSLPVTVLGTEPNYLHAARLSLEGVSSRFITHSDILRRRNVCVITSELARRLYGPDDPVGQVLRLEQEPFTVVGIIANAASIRRLGESVAAGNQVIIPLSTDRQRFGEYNVTRVEGTEAYEKVDVSLAILQMTDQDAVLQAAYLVRPLLKKFHQREDYDVKVPLEEIRQQKSQRKLWNYMFVAIAAISLVVGGIGIMNIMLAGVTERTREIGIRRALGARKRDITAQFLVEAVTLTTVGGLLGILVGAVGIPLVVNVLLDIRAVVGWGTLAVPFTMAMGVGLASGIYPAMRAANLDPIEALRHE